MQTHVGYACPIVSGVVDINLLLYNIQYKRKHICSHGTIASSELATHTKFEDFGNYYL